MWSGHGSIHNAKSITVQSSIITPKTYFPKSLLVKQQSLALKKKKKV